MVNKHFTFFAILLLVLSLLVGCSKTGSGDGSAEPTTEKTPIVTNKKNEPITLRMLVWDVTISDEAFKNWIADPVKQKYPNITIELLRRPGTATLEQLVAMGEFPDMVYEGSKFVDQFNTLKLIEDMTPFVKQNKTDLAKFEPTFVDAVKAYGTNGELYAMPLAMTYDALFYNKDLFDKFNVPYPVDGMTWDQIYELMKKLTRVDGSTQYHGIRIVNNVEAFSSPFALSVYDKKTERAVIATDEWKKAFNIFREFKNYPGNDTGDAAAINNFITVQDYAMFTDTASNTLEQIKVAADKGVRLNWDMVKWPTFAGNPPRMLELSGHVLLMSNTSKYKNEVYDVISLLTDKEVQTKITQEGRLLPALKDPEVRKHYGDNFPTVKGKNMNPVMDQTPAPAVDRTGYAAIARSFIRPAGASTTAFMAGTSDANTTLLEAEVKANKAIQDAKNLKK